MARSSQPRCPDRSDPRCHEHDSRSRSYPFPRALGVGDVQNAPRYRRAHAAATESILRLRDVTMAMLAALSCGGEPLRPGAADSLPQPDAELGGRAEAYDGLEDSEGEPGSAPGTGVQTCTRGGCSQQCTAATCTQDCAAGDCQQVCAKGSHCRSRCAGGGCLLVCADGADCALGCDGGSCRILCGVGARCRLDCAGGDCVAGPSPGLTSCTGSSCPAGTRPGQD